MQITSMSQTCNWMFEMYDAMDSRGEDLTPRPKSDNLAPIFYVITVLFCSFYVINMFAGVVVASYNRESERIGKRFLLTDQ
jgi:hypothetical protein